MASRTDSDDGREQEFLQLFAVAQRPLHAYIMAWVFDPNVAADLLQETNIVLWQKFDLYESGTNFLAWAREIARRAILRHRQLNSGRITTLPPDLLESMARTFSDARASEHQTRQQDALSRCLNKLTEEDRALVMARYSPGASVNGIAVRLQRTVNGVSQSLSRIRRALAECIQRSLRLEEESF
jgi:RNA polymerase sigma-70 factor (ECF subfamily)